MKLKDKGIFLVVAFCYLLSIFPVLEVTRRSNGETGGLDIQNGDHSSGKKNEG